MSTSTSPLATSTDTAANTAPTCHDRPIEASGRPGTGPQLPCGPVNATNPISTCCATGDTCLESGICSYTKSLAGGSGYYTGGCTDSGFGSPCADRCSQQDEVDIVYVPKASLWFCCGITSTGVRLCNGSHSTDSFNADAPNKLAIIGVPDNYTNWASVTSSTPSPTPASSSDSQASQTSVPTSGLSSGAKAGIGIGIAVAALAVIGIISFIVLRKRRTVRAAAASVQPDMPPSWSPTIRYAHMENSPGYGHEQKVEQEHGLHELDDGGRPAELGVAEVAELDDLRTLKPAAAGEYGSSIKTKDEPTWP